MTYVERLMRCSLVVLAGSVPIIAVDPCDAAFPWTHCVLMTEGQGKGARSWPLRGEQNDHNYGTNQKDKGSKGLKANILNRRSN